MRRIINGKKNSHRGTCIRFGGETSRYAGSGCSQYESNIYVEIESKRVNAKSIMGMMTLGLAAGEQITITADGTDEEHAVSEIEKYLSNQE